MTPRWVTCQELVELVTDYLEGVLPDSEVAAVEHHLSLCPPCRRYLAQMRATIEALGYVPVESVSEAAYESLRDVFRRNWSDR
jgi:anti-sigma factor RsiW